MISKSAEQDYFLGEPFEIRAKKLKARQEDRLKAEHSNNASLEGESSMPISQENDRSKQTDQKSYSTEPPTRPSVKLPDPYVNYTSLEQTLPVADTSRLKAVGEALEIKDELRKIKTDIKNTFDDGKLKQIAGEVVKAIDTLPRVSKDTKSAQSNYLILKSIAEGTQRYTPAVKQSEIIRAIDSLVGGTGLYYPDLQKQRGLGAKEIVIGAGAAVALFSLIAAILLGTRFAGVPPVTTEPPRSTPTHESDDSNENDNKGEGTGPEPTDDSRQEASATPTSRATATQEATATKEATKPPTPTVEAAHFETLSIDETVVNKYSDYFGQLPWMESKTGTLWEKFQYFKKRAEAVGITNLKFSEEYYRLIGKKGDEDVYFGLYGGVYGELNESDFKEGWYESMGSVTSQDLRLKPGEKKTKELELNGQKLRVTANNEQITVNYGAGETNISTPKEYIPGQQGVRITEISNINRDVPIALIDFLKSDPVLADLFSGEFASNLKAGTHVIIEIMSLPYDQSDLNKWTTKKIVGSPYGFAAGRSEFEINGQMIVNYRIALNVDRNNGNQGYTTLEAVLAQVNGGKPANNLITGIEYGTYILTGGKIDSPFEEAGQ